MKRKFKQWRSTIPPNVNKNEETPLIWTELTEHKKYHVIIIFQQRNGCLQKDKYIGIIIFYVLIGWSKLNVL
jgi:hypothetical protein